MPPLSDKIILALPKGRILDEVMPLLAACDIIPEDDFTSEDSRKLRFQTNHQSLDIIRVRSFDVATIVAYGGAHIGVAGTDVIEEFNSNDLYTPLDLRIGHCRLSLAAPATCNIKDMEKQSHIRVAAKYPGITERHFARKGIQAECIKLSGAMEIAPALGLAGIIVDLVSSGSTLKANDLVEIETILDVSSRFIVNRQALKTRQTAIQHWITASENALAHAR